MKYILPQTSRLNSTRRAKEITKYTQCQSLKTKSNIQLADA